MSANSVIHPLNYLVIRREGTTWYFDPGKPFYNPRNVPVSNLLEDRLHRFNLTPAKIMVELFRINGGKPGYYLANLKTQKYYYCGSEWADVQPTLHQLGIGQPDRKYEGD